MSKEVVEERFY